MLHQGCGAKQNPKLTNNIRVIMHMLLQVVPVGNTDKIINNQHSNPVKNYTITKKLIPILYLGKRNSCDMETHHTKIRGKKTQASEPIF